MAFACACVASGSGQSGAHGCQPAGGCRPAAAGCAPGRAGGGRRTGGLAVGWAGSPATIAPRHSGQSLRPRACHFVRQRAQNAWVQSCGATGRLHASRQIPHSNSAPPDVRAVRPRSCTSCSPRCRRRACSSSSCAPAAASSRPLTRPRRSATAAATAMQIGQIYYRGTVTYNTYFRITVVRVV